MTDDRAFRVTRAAEDGAPGARACFSHGRALVQRFRAAFPRARRREGTGCRFVPGTRAAPEPLNGAGAGGTRPPRGHAGRFEPLPPSPYLDPSGEDLVVRTPYARDALEILHAIPWARWDAMARVWRVSWRSCEALARRWPELEAAARHEEPEARRRRAAARRADPGARAAALERERERRLRRFPVPVADLNRPGFVGGSNS